MASPVISVEGLGKHYRLGAIGYGSLQRDFASLWARLRGRPDPNKRLDKTAAPTDFWALKDVSFTVEQGQVLGLIGANGAGKSTLLKVLSRITAPTCGKAVIRGRVASMLEVGTGFHPELTGRENIYLNGAILGMNKREIDRKFDEIVAFSEVSAFIDTPVKRYSSGMYVRLAFAVAAHLEPEILLVDEVLAVGDAEFQKKSIGKMGEVSREGRTVVFVSHNMTAVNNLCTRAILLEGGHIVYDGPSADAIKAYLSHGRNLPCGMMFSEPDRPREHAIVAARILFESGEQVRRPISTAESFVIELHFKHNKPVTRQLYAAFYLCAESGQIVLFSDSRDVSTNQQPGTDARRVEEVYRILIPAPLLVPGRYTLTVGLRDQQAKGGVQHDTIEHALAFELVEIEGIRENRPGIINLHCPWQRMDS